MTTISQLSLPQAASPTTAPDMDASVTAAVVSAVGGSATVVATIFTTVRSGKDKKDRAADRTVAEATADKIDAEKEQIAEQTRGMLLKDIRDQLDRTKEQAENYRQEAEKYRNESRALRDALIEKNDRIDAQTRVIRRLTKRAERLTRRAEALEEWIDNNAARFRELGIDGLPVDLLEDRRSATDEDDEENADTL